MSERSLQKNLRGTAGKAGSARRVPRYWFPAHRLAATAPAPPATKERSGDPLNPKSECAK